jgi:hypothetical protein
LATRRDELTRLAALKSRFIAKVNAATPQLDKRALLIPGINAPIEKADDKGITAKPAGANPEHFAWPDLTPKTLDRLIALTINKDSPDDWLSAGLLFLTRVAQPPSAVGASAAEEAFEKAKSLGASIDRYLDPLASAAFSSAKALLDKKDFPAAETALAAIEKKYSATPWLAAHKDDLASARAAAKSGIAESEAEKLYAEAAKLFEKKELFDLKPIIEKLKAEYSKSRPVTDAERKPSLAEMAKATETLGKFLTVRQDGKGDFKTIQAAIDAAPPDSVIEIQDNGPYYEKVLVPKEKPGLTLRGRKGCWPLIRSGGPLGRVVQLVVSTAPRTSLERLVIAHTDAGGQGNGPLFLGGAEGCRIRSIIWGGGTYHGDFGPDGEVESCFCYGVGGGFGMKTPAVLRCTIFLNTHSVGIGGEAKATIEDVLAVNVSGVGVSSPAELRHCTITTELGLGAQGILVRDCILNSVVSSKAGNLIESCDVMTRNFVELARAGKRCFSLDPQFRDPANFDYRLKPTSPCRKKASDGGDIGCRYTPEMLEMLEKALELRKKGIIKF